MGDSWENLQYECARCGECALCQTRRSVVFGAGNPHEAKPFPAGHGGAHGPDEAHNIPVLLTAVKMYILGIQAIDEAWSQGLF